MKILNYVCKPSHVLFLILCIFMSITNIAHADMMPPDSHEVGKCVKIVNIDDFPDYYFIGYITGPEAGGNQFYIIKQEECLTKGYKFNELQILSVDKKYIDSIGIDNFNPFTRIPNKNYTYNKELKCYSDISNKLSPCYDSMPNVEELSDQNITILKTAIDPYG